MDTNISPKSKPIPKIGILGWVGIVIFALGLLTIVTARMNANDLEDNIYKNPQDGQTGFEQLGMDDKMAKDAGFDSYQDYLTMQNFKSGLVFAGIGTVLFIWSRKIKRKKLSQSIPTQIDNPTPKS